MQMSVPSPTVGRRIIRKSDGGVSPSPSWGGGGGISAMNREASLRSGTQHTLAFGGEPDSPTHSLHGHYHQQEQGQQDFFGGDAVQAPAFYKNSNSPNTQQTRGGGGVGSAMAGGAFAFSGGGGSNVHNNRGSDGGTNSNQFFNSDAFKVFNSIPSTHVADEEADDYASVHPISYTHGLNREAEEEDVRLERRVEEALKDPTGRLRLYINNMRCTSLDTKVSRLRGLRELYCQDNARLTRLPHTLWHLGESLTIIHASRCNLDTLPEELSQLRNLRRLSLAGNRLKTFLWDCGPLILIKKVKHPLIIPTNRSGRGGGGGERGSNLLLDDDAADRAGRDYSSRHGASTVVDAFSKRPNINPYSSASTIVSAFDRHLHAQFVEKGLLPKGSDVDAMAAGGCGSSNGGGGGAPSPFAAGGGGGPVGRSGKASQLLLGGGAGGQSLIHRTTKASLTAQTTLGINRNSQQLQQQLTGGRQPSAADSSSSNNNTNHTLRRAGGASLSSAALLGGGAQLDDVANAHDTRTLIEVTSKPWAVGVRDLSPRGERVGDGRGHGDGVRAGGTSLFPPTGPSGDDDDADGDACAGGGAESHHRGLSTTLSGTRVTGALATGRTDGSEDVSRKGNFLFAGGGGGGGGSNGGGYSQSNSSKYLLPQKRASSRQASNLGGGGSDEERGADDDDAFSSANPFSWIPTISKSHTSHVSQQYQQQQRNLSRAGGRSDTVGPLIGSASAANDVAKRAEMAARTREITRVVGNVNGIARRIPAQFIAFTTNEHTREEHMSDYLHKSTPMGDIVAMDIVCPTKDPYRYQFEPSSEEEGAEGEEAPSDMGSMSTSRSGFSPRINATGQKATLSRGATLVRATTLKGHHHQHQHHSGNGTDASFASSQRGGGGGRNGSNSNVLGQSISPNASSRRHNNNSSNNHGGGSAPQLAGGGDDNPLGLGADLAVSMMGHGLSSSSAAPPTAAAEASARRKLNAAIAANNPFNPYNHQHSMHSSSVGGGGAPALSTAAEPSFETTGNTPLPPYCASDDETFSTLEFLDLSGNEIVYLSPTAVQLVQILLRRDVWMRKHHCLVTSLEPSCLLAPNPHLLTPGSFVLGTLNEALPEPDPMSPYCCLENSPGRQQAMLHSDQTSVSAGLVRRHSLSQSPSSTRLMDARSGGGAAGPLTTATATAAVGSSSSSSSLNAAAMSAQQMGATLMLLSSKRGAQAAAINTNTAAARSSSSRLGGGASSPLRSMLGANSSSSGAAPPQQPSLFTADLAKLVFTPHEQHTRLLRQFLPSHIDRCIICGGEAHIEGPTIYVHFVTVTIPSAAAAYAVQAKETAGIGGLNPQALRMRAVGGGAGAGAHAGSPLNNSAGTLRASAAGRRTSRVSFASSSRANSLAAMMGMGGDDGDSGDDGEGGVGGNTANAMLAAATGGAMRTTTMRIPCFYPCCTRSACHVELNKRLGRGVDPGHRALEV